MRKRLLATLVLAVSATVLLGVPPSSSGHSTLPAQLTSTLEPQAYLPLVASNVPFFELGGYVKDQSLPYAYRMHYAGMGWVKTSILFQQDASSIISTAHNNGFKIQLTAQGSINMATPPNFEQDLSNWVSSLTAAGADAIEVWNEPNIDRAGFPGYISPTAYTNLLCASYTAIKAVNTDTLVISAAPAPTGWYGGCTPSGCDDLPWIQGLYAAGAGDCMDYIGAHHVSGATSPSSRSGHPLDPGGTHHSYYFLWQTEEYYDTFQGTKPVFYTSMGFLSQEGVSPFPAWFSWASGTTNAEQAAWLAEAAQLSMSTEMVHYIMVWNIDCLDSAYSPADGYAIIRPGGSCPSCDALHSMLGTR